MYLVVNGTRTYAATGGRNFDPTLPLIVFLHGAGLDHTVWALLARWFAHRGSSVLSPDMPGHGRSDGEPLSSIAAMADWTVALIEAAGASKATIIGHSMGSLVALETAARHPQKVHAMGLIASRSTRSASANTRRAPESDRPYSNSAPVHHALRGTTTAPTVAAAQKATDHSG